MKLKCPRCRMARAKQVVYYPGVGYFDVKRANTILLAKPRRCRRLSPQRTRAMLNRHVVCRRHMPHVDLSVPGLVGQTDDHSFIIDGRHRGTRLSEEGKPSSGCRSSRRSRPASASCSGPRPGTCSWGRGDSNDSHQARRQVDARTRPTARAEQTSGMHARDAED